MSRRQISNELFEVLIVAGVVAALQLQGGGWAGPFWSAPAFAAALLAARVVVLGVSVVRAQRRGMVAPEVEPPSHWQTVRTWRYLRFGVPGVLVVGAMAFVPTGWALLLALTGVVLMSVPLPSYPPLRPGPADDLPADLRLVRWTGASS